MLDTAGLEITKTDRIVAPAATRHARRDSQAGGAALARPAFGFAVAGGLATGALIAAALFAGAPTPTTYQLQQVATNEVEFAAPTLLPFRAAQLVEDAKGCRAPLAVVVLRATGSSGGLVRLRSGGYVSPNIRVGPNAERVAVPFPAPFAEGHGRIVIESAADGVDVFLQPGLRLPANTRVAHADVRWDVSQACRVASP